MKVSGAYFLLFSLHLLIEMDRGMKKVECLLLIIICITISCSQKPKQPTLINNTDSNTELPEKLVEAKDPYIGQYLDEYNREPNLQIFKHGDQYVVQVTIFKLTSLDDGVGQLTPDGLAFTATDASGNPISAVITLNADTAVVTFKKSTWSYIENGETFKYIREIGAEEVINRLCEIYERVAQGNYNSDELAKYYCSSDWNKTVQAINEFDAKNLENIGFFDFDYWIMAQDYDNISISDIVVIDLNNAAPFVMFNLHNLGSELLMKLDIVKENGDWKIDNFNSLGAETLDLKSEMVKYLDTF